LTFAQARQQQEQQAGAILAQDALWNALQEKAKQRTPEAPLKEPLPRISEAEANLRALQLELDALVPASAPIDVEQEDDSPVCFPNVVSLSHHSPFAEQARRGSA
jgi:hypothetical protein